MREVAGLGIWGHRAASSGAVPTGHLHPGVTLLWCPGVQGRSWGSSWHPPAPACSARSLCLSPLSPGSLTPCPHHSPRPHSAAVTVAHLWVLSTLWPWGRTWGDAQSLPAGLCPSSPTVLLPASPLAGRGAGVGLLSGEGTETPWGRSWPCFGVSCPGMCSGPTALDCPGTVLLMCHIFCISFLIPPSVEQFLGNELKMSSNPARAGAAIASHSAHSQPHTLGVSAPHS